MSPRPRPMRYAHSEGHTDLCYSVDGRHLITCGSDGEVRIWAGIEDDDCETVCVAEEKAIAVAHKEGHIYVGTDDNIVQAYTFPENKRDGIISRYTAPVTNINISSSGFLIASGSCDMEVKITDLKMYNNLTLTGHTAPILGVAVDPKEKYVVSSSCDGSIRVWDLKSQISLKQWNCVPKCNSFFTAPVLARASWQPSDSHYLAIPDDKTLRLHEYGSWSQIVVFEAAVSQPLSITAFSPCGKYVAAVAGNEICVWDVTTQSQVYSFKHEREYKICALAWNPKQRGELAYCDVFGQIGTIESVIPDAEFSVLKSVPEPAGKVNKVDASADLKGFDGDSFSFSHHSDDDDDDENVISLDKIKSQTLGLNEDIDETGDTDNALTGRNSPMKFEVHAQPTFQPSSTPESLQYRYMVYNSVGIIRCVNNGEENSIDARFHDIAVHHTLHMSNVLGHTMAALSRQALVLAAPEADDSPSKVACIVLNTWDDTKEWTVSLPEGENAAAVAVGDDWFAVATSLRHLRIFGIAGTQRQVLSLPGPIVCLAAAADKLLVVFHAGLGLPGEQCLGYQLFTISNDIPVYSTASQHLPITPGSRLQWAGFSDEISVFTLDSADMLRMLPRRSAHWYPVCDTSEHCKGASDHYFVVGVSEQDQKVRAVLCRGAHYPPTSPLPIISELPLKIPLCEMETDKGPLEEALWRSVILLSSMKAALQSSTDEKMLFVAEECSRTAEKIQNESLMKLFALSARGSLGVRAVEICNLMPTAHLTELAAKYSSKLNLTSLVDRVSKIMHSKREKEESRSQRLCSPDIFASQTRSGVSDRHFDSLDNINGSADTASRDESETENLILAIKRKREEEEKRQIIIKPTIISQTQKKLNPFAKKSASVNRAGTGLEKIAASCDEKEKLEKKKKSLSASSGLSNEPSIKPKPQSKQMNLFGKAIESPENESKSSKAGKKVLPFMQWFSQNKDDLREEFPELDDGDLTKMAMKRYRGLGTNSNTSSSSASAKTADLVSRGDTNGLGESETKKRRIENKENESNVEDCPMQAEDESLESDALDILEKAMRQEEEKMRELPDKAPRTDVAAEKKSGISKLSKFAFTKSE